MERQDPKQVLGGCSGRVSVRLVVTSASRSSTAMSSSSLQEPTQMRPCLAYALICPAARPAARITRASARSSAAGKRRKALIGLTKSRRMKLRLWWLRA